MFITCHSLLRATDARLGIRLLKVRSIINRDIVNTFSAIKTPLESLKMSEQATEDKNSWKNAKSIYEFTVKDIDGNDVSLEKYRGHVVLIVNVACKCGLTSDNYKHLQTLHERYSESKGLRILGFPCNQFAGQEPGSAEEIKEFVKGFEVGFPLFSKINVNGDGAHPLYKYLKSKQGGLLGDFIKWNFTKFLVDKEGQPVKRYGPKVDPFDVEKDFDKYW